MLAAKGLPSHNYLDDIVAGRKSTAALQIGTPAAAKQPEPGAKQGNTDAK
jgi:hypothetical protein